MVVSQIATLRKGLEDVEREALAAPMSTEIDTFKNVMNVSFYIWFHFFFEMP